MKNIDSVYCGKEVWQELEAYLETNQPTKIFVLADSNTRVFCLPVFKEHIPKETDFELIEIPEGEIHKNINSCVAVWNQLSDSGADRNSLLINLGGGVITDLGGFVASTFKRGISFINIPTSLLAMVDASVGGKNGVDLGVLKNQVGVIKDADMVLIDVSFLNTLPEAHFNSGKAEMLKHGLIASDSYWESLKSVDAGSGQLESLIWESVVIKSEIVTEDPLERNRRKTLNFGHTLGHAIESYCLEHSHIRSLLHGEAIAIGMILETYISGELLAYPMGKVEEVCKYLKSSYDEIKFSSEDIEAIIKLMAYDKKNKGGKVLFVLLENTASPSINHTVDNSLIIKAFEYYQTL